MKKFLSISLVILFVFLVAYDLSAMGNKVIINKTKEKLVVKLYLRKGMDPSSHGKTMTVIIPARHWVNVTYGSSSGETYLNGIEIVEFRRHKTVGIWTVAHRGTKIDNMLNKKRTIIVKSKHKKYKISGTNH